MARLHGRSGLIMVSVTSAADASPVAYLSGWDISITEAVSEVTPHGSPNQEYIGGIPDITGDFSGFYDDSSQQLYLAARDGVPRSFYLYPSHVTDPAQYWFGKLIADFANTGDVTAPVAVKAAWKAASSIFRNDFTGIPPTNAIIPGAAAPVTVAGGAGHLVTSANIAGVAAAVTVLGGTGQAGSVPQNIAGVAAAVTVAGGAGAPSAGANIAGVAAAVSVDAGIGVAVGHGLHTDTFTTAGSSTWLCPAGVTSVIAECWGGGGNGGKGGSGSGGVGVGGGGGGGAEYANEPLAVTPGNSYNYTVGAAGANSTFGPDDLGVTVTGHKGNNGGNGSVNSGVPGTAGTAGSGSTNTTHFSGGAGKAGTGSSASNGDGGGGGGSGGTASAGNAAPTVPTGATAVTGGGNGGVGAVSGGNGAAPTTGPGGGGGGGANILPGNGGAGHAGQVAVSYST